jgi:hypothetical protein
MVPFSSVTLEAPDNITGTWVDEFDGPGFQGQESPHPAPNIGAHQVHREGPRAARDRRGALSEARSPGGAGRRHQLRRVRRPTSRCTALSGSGPTRFSIGGTEANPGGCWVRIGRRIVAYSTPSMRLDKKITPVLNRGYPAKMARRGGGGRVRATWQTRVTAFSGHSAEIHLL